MLIAEMANSLRASLGEAASRVPTRELPNWLVRLVGVFDGQVRAIVPELGRHKHATNAKAQKLLRWEPRSREDAIAATGESLVRLGLVRTSQ